MKKIKCLIASLLLCSSAAFANTIVIYDTKQDNDMVINYRSCFLDISKTNALCDPVIHHTTIKKGHDITSIKLDASQFVQVVEATEINGDGIQVAHNTFPGDEDCRAFEYHPATLEDNGEGSILCLRTQP